MERPIPDTIPNVKKSSSILSTVELQMRPTPAINPPIMHVGRQPYLFVIALAIGPVMRGTDKNNDPMIAVSPFVC